MLADIGYTSAYIQLTISRRCLATFRTKLFCSRLDDVVQYSLKPLDLFQSGFLYATPAFQYCVGPASKRVDKIRISVGLAMDLTNYAHQHGHVRLQETLYYEN